MRPKLNQAETFVAPDPAKAMDNFKRVLGQVTSVPKECVDQALKDEEMQRKTEKRDLK